MDVKVPTNIIELLELEKRYDNAQIYVSQSDNYAEIQKAYLFIDKCEQAFSKCTVKYKYD